MSCLERFVERHETSCLSCLQQRLELACIATLDEEAIRIVPIGQLNLPGLYSLRPETARKMLRSACAAAIGVGVERQIDSAWTITQLLELARTEMVSQGAGNVVKAGLPHHSIIEQTFH